MRAVFSSLIIFLIIITLGITQICVTNKYIASLNVRINALDTAIQNNDISTFKEELSKALKKWSKMRFVLSLMIRHDYIFEIDSALTELENFSERFDYADASLSLSKAKLGAQCIAETSSFIIENII